MELVDVTAENVEETSFFCKMSGPTEVGYGKKLAWLKLRFAEGMRMKMLGQRKGKRWAGGRGFIEYIPGEFAWRPVNAAGYMVIHCLWVVGKSKGNGGGRELLQACIEDARAAGMKGVAMLTSDGNWATDPSFLEHFGFECVDEAPPKFKLMALRFDEETDAPTFSDGVKDGPASYPHGLTALVSAQCPYNAAALDIIREAALQHGIIPEVIELETAAQLRSMAPTAYGTFNVILDGELLTYSHMLRKQLDPLIEARLAAR